VNSTSIEQVSNSKTASYHFTKPEKLIQAAKLPLREFKNYNQQPPWQSSDRSSGGVLNPQHE
jgi:hypothetical protein